MKKKLKCRVCGRDITEKGVRSGSSMWCLECGRKVIENMASCNFTIWGVELKLDGHIFSTDRSLG